MGFYYSCMIFYRSASKNDRSAEKTCAAPKMCYHKDVIVTR